MFGGILMVVCIFVGTFFWGAVSFRGVCAAAGGQPAASEQSMVHSIKRRIDMFLSTRPPGGDRN
jgi:hypothetical protein